MDGERSDPFTPTRLLLQSVKVDMPPRWPVVVHPRVSAEWCVEGFSTVTPTQVGAVDDAARSRDLRSLDTFTRHNINLDI